MFNSSDKTLGFLSILYSAISLLMICFFSYIAYNEVNKIMKNSIGSEVNANIKIFAFSLIFVVTCYWVSNICGKFFFSGKTESTK